MKLLFKNKVFFAFSFFLISPITLASHCDGVTTTFPEAESTYFANLIASSLNNDPPDADQTAINIEIKTTPFFQMQNWIGISAQVPNADPGIFFFEKQNNKNVFRDVWGGVAFSTEQDDVMSWGLSLGMPESFAECFARTITGNIY